MRIIKVKVAPRSRESSIRTLEDGTLIAKLKSPPVDGKANEELIALIAKHHGVSRASVSIKSGASSRLKLVCIDES